TVRAMAMNGTTLYIGGEFTSIGATTRNRIGAFNNGSLTPTTWNPNANGTVHALAIGAGGLVYAGGEFFMIGGMGRNHIAALDPIFNQNQATAWDPHANDNVYALAVAGNTVFAGGDFTSL